MTQLPSMTYPSEIRRERFADAAMHLLGFGGAVVTLVWLLILAFRSQGVAQIWAVSIYGGFLIFAFGASAAYHLWPWHGARPFLRRLDHASIFLKIAATYTPLAVIVGSGFAYGVLTFVWLVAIAGAIMRLTVWRVPSGGMLGIYLALGWFSLTLIWPLSTTAPAATIWLILAGGILYSVGAVLYHREISSYLNAIWHGFVIAATACLAVAIGLAL